MCGRMSGPNVEWLDRDCLEFNNFICEGPAFQAGTIYSLLKIFQDYLTIR